MTTGMNILTAVLSGAAALTVLVMMVRTGKPVRRAATFARLFMVHGGCLRCFRHPRCHFSAYHARIGAVK